MTSRKSRRRALPMAIAVVLSAAVACGGGGDGGPAEQIAPSGPHDAASRDPATPAVPALTPVKADPEDLNRARQLMLQSFDFNTGVNVVAVEKIGDLGVQQSIIPLIELTRFVFKDYDVVKLGEALQKLTGAPFGGSEWDKWYRWLGKQPELEPLKGYVTWKGDIYSRIDPRFESFFQEFADHRIPVWAIQWGGVARDGIPPLENPHVIGGDTAGYLRPDDPVFGAVVNGEARAYPWRHMASHELANDMIQGKPVTVVF